MSGLFGIGGGTIIVPALVWLGLTQRHAAATSMLAIVPTSVSGVLAYAVEGNVDWIAALLMFLGMFIGGQIGSLLLSRLPEVVLRWAFRGVYGVYHREPAYFLYLRVIRQSNLIWLLSC